MAEQQGWTAVTEPSGWTPVANVSTPSAADILSGQVGRETNLSDTPTEPDWKARLNDALQGPAHPQTVGDFSALVLPSAVGLRTVTPMLRAGIAGAKESQSVFKAPGYFLRGMARYVNTEPAADHEITKIISSGAPRVITGPAPDVWDLYGRSSPAESVPAAPPTAAPSTSSQALSQVERSGLERQGYPPGLIARIEERLGGHAPQPMPSHPLTQPRIDVGAVRVGRQAGMTPDAVRQATGPVLDEVRGEASPILPQQALNKIIDDMRQIAPGPEREAYVARATSGKTKWQVENIRRTLEHLGLMVPAAVSLRDPLLSLMASHAPSATSSR